jgi:gluconate 2-dehydrogenase gamma chain
MSGDEPLYFRQDRRSWLKTSAAALVSAVLPIPAISTPTRRQPPEAAGSEAESERHFFTPMQHALVEELAEAIIPADSHSGGAKAAKVADYIDQIVGTSVNEGEKALWKEGLRLIELMSQHRNGKSFVDSNSDERIAVLTILSDHSDLNDLPEIQFFQELKRLTVRGYYTSEIGIHDELEYHGNKVLLEFTGCEDPAKEPA